MLKMLYLKCYPLLLCPMHSSPGKYDLKKRESSLPEDDSIHFSASGHIVLEKKIFSFETICPIFNNH